MKHSNTRACRVGLGTVVACAFLFLFSAAVYSILFLSAAALPAVGRPLDQTAPAGVPGEDRPALYTSSAYSDVGSSDLYAEAVAELSRRGCISGYADGSFSPNAPITRQQFGKVLALALGLPVTEEDVCSFSDVTVGGPDSLYPDNYVAALAHYGLVLGTGAGRFSPEGVLRHSQIEAMLARGAGLVAPYVPLDVVLSAAGSGLPAGLPVTRGQAVQAVYDFVLLVEMFREPPAGGVVTGQVWTAGSQEAEGTDGPAGSRVGGAVVTVQATDKTAETDRAGRFEIGGLEPGVRVVLTAWAPGYLIGSSEPVLPASTGVKILLRPIPVGDDPDYEWLSAYGTEPESPNCQRCHSGTQEQDEGSAGKNTDGGSLPFDEWSLDAHAGSAVNPRFLSMYAGTDLQGNLSPSTRYVWDRDYGRRPLPPDLNLPYYGPGYQLDFPGTKGNCATCHVPVAALGDPYGVDPTDVTGVAAEGVGCDFCHKVWGVNVDPATGLPYENAPGVLSMEMKRPSSGAQFFAGPFADVAPGDDTFSPLQIESLYCASCHSARFWGTQIYDSYGEWLASPYSDPVTGQTCQDCHMPSRGATLVARPEVGGNTRDPDTVRSHLMPGAADVELLERALTLKAEAGRGGGQLHVKVTVTNDSTGHHVPTDSPLRQVLLVVQAEGPRGESLERLSGPVLPEWAGTGADAKRGRYGGLAGVAYAKILREPWTGVSPSGAYWNPTVIESDTRLAAFASQTTTYTFASAPADTAIVRVVLLYRRAFLELAEQKGWALSDIVMAEQMITLAAP